MRRITIGLVVAALALVAALPVSAGEGNKGNGVSGDPIFTTAGMAGFTELAGAIQYVDTELGTELETLFEDGTDQFTVFAPDNAAFSDLYALLSSIPGLDVDSIDDIPAPIVLAVLEYHVTEGRRFSNSVVPKGNNDKTIETIGGGMFTVNADGEISDAFGQTAKITDTDISASNGAVHVIDTVIVPVDLATLLDLLGLS